MKRTISIALAFVGLMVGAGFATGQEVIQYFIAFGPWGFAGAVVSGILMAVTGAVILQLGSYFLAEEHFSVFRNVSHPIISRIMDWCVIVTLFCLGFVMLAGAGSNLEQQFGLKAWIGSAIMLVLVMATGFLDVDRVSNIIGAITPLVIVAVIFLFIYALLHLPENLEPLHELAESNDSPIPSWWLAALNYNGLCLLMGVSMCLVIGGTNSDLKSAWRGGLAGGAVFMIMLVMEFSALYLNIETVQGSDVPTLELFNSISPVLSFIMVWIIFGMIYNTAIGMFYALGRRLTASNPSRFHVVYLIGCLAGFAVSFVGFKTLLTAVFPILGYLGILLVGALVAWWIKSRVRITREAHRRERLRDLTYAREHPDEEFTHKDAKELEKITDASHVEDERLAEQVHNEVVEELEADPEVDYEYKGDGTGSHRISH